MSTERMIVTAMQEQPMLLLPFLLALYFIARLVQRTAQALSLTRTPAAALNSAPPRSIR